MAFLKDNKYIKLFETGSFKVYPSAEKRQQYKNATSSEVILAKYQELKKELDQQLMQVAITAGYTEESLSNPELWKAFRALPELNTITAKFAELNREMSCYEWDLSAEKGAKHDFPLIEKFYPDVKESIPEIIESAGIGFWKSSNLADMYEEAKRERLFGETEDC